MSEDSTNRPSHGHARTAEYGGLHPTFKAWRSIVRRCEQPSQQSYPRYGGRGIRVCRRWRTYQEFYADVGDRPSPDHSIDRIDNDRGYDCGTCDDCLARGAPPNCRWRTSLEQARNKRNTIYLTMNGVTLPLTEWAEQVGLSSKLLRKRKQRFGWSDEACLTTPVLTAREASMRAVEKLRRDQGTR